MKHPLRTNPYTALRIAKRIEIARHRTRREGDEIACSCGKRWGTDEEHP